MRKTFASWEEICDFIKKNKGENKSMMMIPVSWYGEKKKDRKTKEYGNEVGDVHSITFEIQVMPRPLKGLSDYLGRL